MATSKLNETGLAQVWEKACETFAFKRDAQLEPGISIGDSLSKLDENISNEIDRATNKEDEIESALNSEITRAKNAENTLETNKVPITRTINGKALSSDITLSASDVGADASGSANTALTNAKAYTDTKVADLVGTAPETLDTLEELADALKDNADIVDVLNEAITSKASAVDLTSHMSNNTAHITADERTAWNDANNKKHEHTNKTILDNTTASYTTEEKEKLSGIKEGAETTATTTSGSNPTVTNSADAQLIYGKIAGYTVQDGVPTSDSPVDIQGLGDSGSVEVKTCGKNLLTNNLDKIKSVATMGSWTSNDTYVFSGLTYKINADGTITVNGTTTNQYNHHIEYPLSVKKGNIYSGYSNGTRSTYIFETNYPNYIKKIDNNTYECIADGIVQVRCSLPGAKGATYTNEILYPIMVSGDVALTEDDYEPYTETTAIIPLDLPLYDGDYIEVYADGSGKIVRTMGKKVITSSDYVDMPYPNIFRYVIHEGYDSSGSYTDRKLKGYSNRFAIKQSYDDMTIYDAILETVNNDGWGGNIRATITMPTSFNTKELMNEFVDNNEVYFIYPLKESVETELTAEQVAQFKKLYTFDNVTNFFCDGEITARYYVNTDSGDTVGRLQKSISEMQEIEIGGRNYCRNNSYWKNRDVNVMQITNNDDGSVSITKIVEKNGKHCYIPFSSTLDFGEYTLTVKYKATERSEIAFYIIDGGAGVVDEGLVLPQSDDYTILSKTVTVANNTDALFVSSTAMVLNSTLDIAWIKVEKGNKSTDWTPNPDDTVTINDAEIGSAINLRTANSYNFKFTSAPGERYYIFAKLPLYNSTSNNGATLLVTDTSNFANPCVGTYVVQIANRAGSNSAPNMYVRQLVEGDGKTKFGYYIDEDNDYIYFGAYVPSYTAGTYVTVLSKRENTEIGAIASLSTKPDTWTVVETKYTPQPSASDTVAGIMKLYTGTGSNTDGTMTQDAITTALDDKFGATVSRTANTVLAAPNGSAGGASFRKLVADDIPRLKNSWNFSFSVSGGTVDYRTFAKILKTDTNNSGATLLITDGGNYGNTHVGAWIVHITNRGGNPSMHVRALETSSNIVFGFWSKDDYYYFGAKCEKYSAGLFCTVLSSRGNTTIGKIATSSTQPSNWTEVDFLYTPQPSASTSTAGIGKLYTATGTGTDGSMTQSAITEALNGKAVKKELISENLNDIKTPGFYNAGGGNSVTNKPSGVVDHFGLYVVKRASGDYYTQILIDSNKKQYRRHCDNGTWGSWVEDKLTDTNTTYSNFVKSGSGAKAGLVPAPSTTAGTTKYLREDGTWAVPPNTTYTSLKNPYTLTIQGNGTTLTNGTYDGSAAKTVNITPSSIGAAASSHTHNYLPLSGGTVTGNLEFSNSGTTTRGVIGTVGGNDYWRIVGGATADNDAYLEIATADDGNEPIYVRQYSKGKFGTLTRTATLLDGSGNTKFPGKVTASSFAGALTGNVTGNVSGSSGSCTGNSATATKLKTARTISLTGSVTGSGTFDGSGNLSIATTTNHTHNYLPLAGGDMNGVLNTQNLIPNNAYRLVGNNSNPYYYGYFKNMCSNIFNITDSSNNSVSSISYDTSTDTMYYSANNVNAPFSDVVGLSISSGWYYNMRLYGKNIRLESKNYISSNVTIAMASDEKVKSFTEDIAIDEEKLVKLFDIIKPKSYSYKYLKSDSVNIGFSAQEIEQAMIDLDIDPEKYGILHIQYGHIVSRGSDFEDGKYYTKFYEISYNDLFNLALLKTHMMEKEHVERLVALEEKASKLDELEARLSALENK